MQLNSRQLDLLQTLTRRVRMLCVAHVAAVWWPGKPARRLRRRLRAMECSGLLELHTINAQPLAPVKHPLFAWHPGAVDPDFERLAASTSGRWRLPALPITVCVATPLTANLFGSTARGLPPLEHRNHDLWLAAVYVHYRQRAPRTAQLWIGEHALPKAGYRIKDPDAFLIDARGQVRRVIEAAGRYRREQVEAFHEHCCENNLPYEIW